MPSKAFNKFEKYMLKDVERLLAIHRKLNHTGPGRRGLGYITRSGILMLCSAWELYAEELTVESIKYITTKTTSPDNLPKSIKKTLATYTKNHKHELKVLELAGDGWKKCLIDSAKENTAKLHSPKTNPINSLFDSFVGLKKLSDCWTTKDIDTFVTLRGEIAHKGSQANYIKINELRKYFDMIKKTALETDNHIALHLKDVTPSNTMPWRRRT